MALLPVLSARAQGPFCGAVGTAGCNAVAYDSSAIVGWATGCTVVRGPVNITDPDGPCVRFGADSMAIGPAGKITTVAVSLGDGGTATLTFGYPICNGDGPDFAVFENPFDDNFLELAFVEVSTDGERYVRFPSTSLTQTETQVGPIGKVDPTMINNLAGKFRVGYGTPFDLEELRDSAGINIDSIVYVRLIDAVGCIDSQYATFDAFGHIVNDPWPTDDVVYASGGFDLTGVGVLHHRSPNGIHQVMPVITNIWPNPAVRQVSITCGQSNTPVEMYDMAGRLVRRFVLSQGTNDVDLGTLVPGVYLFRAQGCTHKVVVGSYRCVAM